MNTHHQPMLLNLLEKTDLYQAYMPFIKGGGIFVATPQHYQLNDRVTLKITLMTEAEQYVLDGKVVWITPKSAQSGRAAGIGVQFTGDAGKRLRDKVEMLVANYINK
jgi:type IV pilus assembly protein PilZ